MVKNAVALARKNHLFASGSRRDSDMRALFGERANTGCICEGSESAVMAKTGRGAANVVIFPG
jgi:hypothetical protein